MTAARTAAKKTVAKTSGTSAKPKLTRKKSVILEPRKAKPSVVGAVQLDQETEEIISKTNCMYIVSCCDRGHLMSLVTVDRDLLTRICERFSTTTERKDVNASVRLISLPPCFIIVCSCEVSVSY